MMSRELLAAPWLAGLRHELATVPSESIIRVSLLIYKFITLAEWLFSN
jgi:hypothetical protein